MKATLVVHNDPFRPSMNVDTSEVLSGKTVCETLIDSGFCTATETGIQRNTPFFVLLNGNVVLQDSWNIVLSDEDFLQVTRLPRGGGGGGSNIGNILGAIVIAVAAYFTFGLSLAATVAVGAVAYVALTLISGPVGLPTSATSSGTSTSPTYSLSAQGNSARLLQAMPRVYGRMKTYPDLAAQPYSDYQGNEQFLYQLFCISLGRIEVEGIYFDDSLISNFVDAEYQIVNPGQAVTLFPDNVVVSDSVSGQTMLAPNNPNYLVIGPYSAVPAGKKANFIGIDISNPAGVGKINDEGKTITHTVTLAFQYREIDDLGNPIGNWNELVNVNQTFATTQAQMASFKIAVPEGRYQVQGYRSTPEVTDNRTYDTTQWVSLRAYLVSTYTYGNCTLLAVKARATNSLNSTTARKLSVISKGLVQVWDPVNGWGEYQFSDSPAWIAADILRDPDYGRGLPTSRLNISKFYSLAQTWAARGDTFNGVFDTTGQLWDAVTKVCRVGRAVPMYYAGMIDIVRDEPASLPTAKFGPGQMIEGSFEATYSFFDINTPDHVVVQYTNPDTWEVSEVTCALPGETALNPATVDMTQGVTNRDQAYREGMSLAAGNRDRRRSITFSTLTQGLILKYNGLIRINHDVPQWGYSGRVISFDQASGKLRSSEPIYFDANSSNVIAFANKDGSELGPYTMVADATANADEGVFGCIVSTNAQGRAAIANIISNGFKRDFTFYSCGPTERQGIKALVLSAKPDSEGKVSVSCINYADSVHTAETGGVVPPPNPESNLPGIPSAPIVDSVTVVYTVTVGEQNIIASPARGAIYYEFQAKLSDSESWSILGNQDMPTLTVHLQPGQWDVRVRGIARNVGPWASWSGTIEATSLPVPELDTFVARSGLFAIPLEWQYKASGASIAAYIEVYAGLTNVLGDSLRLFKLPYPATNYNVTGLLAGERRFFWARVIDIAGRVGPWFNGGFPITQTASADPSPILDLILDSLTKDQFGQDLKEEIDGKATQEYVDGKVTELEDQIGDIVSGGVYNPNEPYLKYNTVRVGNNLWSAVVNVPAKADGSNGPPNATYWVNAGLVTQEAGGFAAAIQQNKADIEAVEDSVTAQASQIQGVQSALDGKASATSVSQLSNTVSQQGQTISSQGQAITSVTNKVDDPATGLAAQAGAINSLSNTVSNQGDALNAQAEIIQGVNAQINPSLAGETTSYAGSNQVYVGVYSIQSAVAEGDYAQGKRSDTILVQLNNQTAAIEVAQSVSIQAVGLANSAQSTANSAQGVANSANGTATTLKNQVDISYQVKLQANNAGDYTFAGFGIGLSNASGVFQSRFVVAADSFVIATTAGADYAQSPFAVVGTQTFIKDAFISKLAVVNGVVGSSLYSQTYTSYGVPRMTIDFNGGTQTFRHPTKSNTYKVTDANADQWVIDGVLRVRIGSW